MCCVIFVCADTKGCPTSPGIFICPKPIQPHVGSDNPSNVLTLSEKHSWSGRRWDYFQAHIHMVYLKLFELNLCFGPPISLCPHYPTLNKFCVSPMSHPTWLASKFIWHSMSRQCLRQVNRAPGFQIKGHKGVPARLDESYFESLKWSLQYSRAQCLNSRPRTAGV